MTLSSTLVFFTNWVKSMPFCHIGSPDWWVCCFEINVSGCTWAATPVLGDPNITAFLKAQSLRWFYSTCTPTTCQLHMAENSFMLTRYVSPLKANTSANWNAVSRQIWRGCRKWRLKPSASKTISSVFHLHNTSATRKLSVYLDG